MIVTLKECYKAHHVIELRIKGHRDNGVPDSSVSAPGKGRNRLGFSVKRTHPLKIDKGGGSS